MKVVFKKDNYQVFFQIFKKNDMKIFFTKDDFHINFFEKIRESYLL